jgi:hypothetical protein
MQPSKIEKAVRWLLFVGFVIASGMGTARSNCCCVTPLTELNSGGSSVDALVAKSCCRVHESDGGSSQSCSQQCDPSKCGTEESCGVDCGCAITAATPLVYKEPESSVSKALVAESRLESVGDYIASSVEAVQPVVFRPAVSAQESCTLMCTWQK